MIVKIQTQDGVAEYDVSKIDNNDSKIQAEVLVRKVSTIETLREALQIANVVHRKSLEDVVIKAPESKVQTENSEDK